MATRLQLAQLLQAQRTRRMKIQKAERMRRVWDWIKWRLATPLEI